MDICVEVLPRPQLRRFVECVWYTEPAVDTRFEIVPDGSVDACFVLSETNPRILLFGTTTRTSAYELEAGASYFGVRFRPGNATAFIQERIADLTDTQLAVSGFLGLSAEQILETEGFGERRACLESALMGALSRRGDRAAGALCHAISQIDSRHGDIRVRDLATSCNMSERQLERLFIDGVGISPKLYMRIRRFRSVLSHLEDPADHQQPKMADVAASFGYADQSHLVRDFHDFSHSLASAH